MPVEQSQSPYFHHHSLADRCLMKVVLATGGGKGELKS
jgi:hypothetical protein